MRFDPAYLTWGGGNGGMRELVGARASFIFFRGIGFDMRGRDGLV